MKKTAYHDVYSLRIEGHKHDPQCQDMWRLFQPVSWSVKALNRHVFCCQFCCSRNATCKKDVVVWRRANRQTAVHLYFITQGHQAPKGLSYIDRVFLFCSSLGLAFLMMLVHIVKIIQYPVSTAISKRAYFAGKFSSNLDLRDRQ